jgi:hypothetical protein
VDKGGVNDGLRSGRSAAEAFQIFEITPTYLGASPDQGIGACIGARQSKHLMPCIN